MLLFATLSELYGCQIQVAPSYMELGELFCERASGQLLIPTSNAVYRRSACHRETLNRLNEHPMRKIFCAANVGHCDTIIDESSVAQEHSEALPVTTLATQEWFCQS